MGNGNRKRPNVTRAATWCCIAIIGVVAFVGLIFGICSFVGVRDIQKQSPSEFEAQEGSRFIVPQKKTVLGMDGNPRGGSPNSHKLETEEVATLFFGDQGEIVVENDGISSKMSFDLNFNTTNFLKGNGPPCDNTRALTIDTRNNECPRGFIGINDDSPECNLHVNGTMCVVGETLLSGSVTIDGNLFVNNIIGANITAVQCNDNSQCNDLNNCTTDQCVSNFCEHSLVDSCASSNDCPGNGVCGSDCTCMDFLKPQCEFDLDCDDSDACTEDTCNSGFCENKVKANCCINNGDCDDGNPCTINICLLLGPSGTCDPSSPIPGGECSYSRDCAGNAVCGENCTCTEFLIPQCEVNLDCDDSDDCTSDTCVSGICKNKAEIDQDADGVPCSVDCDDTDNSIGGSMKWFRDADEDGDGDIDTVLISCTQPNGYVKTNTDCDDNNPDVFHGSSVCNFTDFYNQFEFGSIPFPPLRGFKNAGASVSVHNDKTIIGAPAASSGKESALIIKRYADNIWIEEALLVPINSTFTTNTQFGRKVKIYNDIALVACRTCFSEESVFVFEFISESWTLVDIIIPDPGLAALSIDLLDEKILITGRIAFDTTILIYDRNQTWELTQSINATGVVRDIAFDKANSNFFVVGFRGNAELYLSNGTQYNLSPAIIEGGLIQINFGASVDFDNGIMVIGSPFPNTTENLEISYVYSVSGENVTAVQILLPKHLPSSGAFSGCGVSIAIANDMIVVGCPQQEINSIQLGSANVYKLVEGKYHFIANMFPPRNSEVSNSTTSLFYGLSVDIDAEVIVVGDPFSDVFSENDGNVFMTHCTEIRTC